MKEKITKITDCIISLTGLLAVMTIDYSETNTVQLILLSFAALYQFAKLAMTDREIAPVQKRKERKEDADGKDKQHGKTA